MGGVRRSAMPTMSPTFRLRRWWNTALDFVYPGSPPVCVLCHRMIPPLTNQHQRKDLSQGAQTPESVRQLVCPFCLQEARSTQARLAVRKLSVPIRPYRSEVEDRVVSGAGAKQNTGSTKAAKVYIPVYSAFRYEGFVQRSIRPWKYDGALGLTDWFSHAIATTIGGAGVHQQLEMIVPVPTSVARFRQRGYHQTLLLAKALGSLWKKPVVQVLERSRAETAYEPGRETQTAKTAGERRASLAGAFRPSHGVNLSGLRLMLVDDVVTTGATMQACAEQLFAAGAASVVCTVIADVE